MTHDAVNHPSHYTSHPARCECGKPIECIQITEHMGFCLGNAIKYLWRADLKGAALEDLAKAKWYIEREIFKRQREQEQVGKELVEAVAQNKQEEVLATCILASQPLGIKQATVPSALDVVSNQGWPESLHYKPGMTSLQREHVRKDRNAYAHAHSKI